MSDVSWQVGEEISAPTCGKWVPWPFVVPLLCGGAGGPGAGSRPYAVEEVELPSITEPAQAWFRAVAEMKTLLFPTARQHGSPTIQEIFSWYDRAARGGDGAHAPGAADLTTAPPDDATARAT